ncbi:hypothetical protein ACIBCA_29930 [Kitasatospora sp. NPDC051170]|uniref:hypothetical protein n=1 Tax=Kitasatospora sp. NPDC051170 TaxID=3364056 RepID=UPI00379B7F4E
MRDIVKPALIAASVCAGLAAGASLAVSAVRSIRADGPSGMYETLGQCGGYVVVAVPFVLLALLRQRFLGPSGTMSRRRWRHFRLVAAVVVIVTEVPIFWFVTPGIVGLGAPRGDTWAAVLGCVAGILIVVPTVAALTYLLLDAVVERLRGDR